MQIKNLPEKFLPLWEKVLPMLQSGRAGDALHASQTVETILEFSKKQDLDLDIFVPLGMMHDIGHMMILPEHMKYVAGSEKIDNSKLVHMLVGAKIAKDILDEVDYSSIKTKEITDIISIHDMSQMKKGDFREEEYNTENKRIFHDIDAFGRFSLKRIKALEKKIPMNNTKRMMEGFLEDFFDPEMQKIAQAKFEKIKDQL